MKLQKKSKKTIAKVKGFVKRWSILLLLVACLYYLGYAILHSIYIFSKVHPNRYILLITCFGVLLMINEVIADNKHKQAQKHHKSTSEEQTEE